MAIKRISPEEARALVEDQGYSYLDVRSVPEFEAGHPVGAYNIPLLHMGPGGMSFGGIGSATIDAEGNWILRDVPPGEYELEATAADRSLLDAGPVEVAVVNK